MLNIIDALVDSCNNGVTTTLKSLYNTIESLKIFYKIEGYYGDSCDKNDKKYYCNEDFINIDDIQVFNVACMTIKMTEQAKEEYDVYYCSSKTFTIDQEPFDDLTIMDENDSILILGIDYYDGEVFTELASSNSRIIMDYAERREM